MTDEIHPPYPRVSPTRSRPISLVWIAPIAAVIICIWVIWSSAQDRGPLVEITFPSAAGIESGTEIRRNDVPVGEVEDVRLSEDAASVVVSARLDPELEPFLGQTTQFWVVNAQISSAGVSGLETLLSGAYIAVDWEEEARRSARRFEGAVTPPRTPAGTPGVRIVLTAEDAGSVRPGSPLLYRGLEVGRIETRELTDEGEAVRYEAFVEAPYNAYVTPSTRFWNTIGVNISASTSGVSIDVGTLTNILSGAVSFGEVGGALGDPLTQDGETFTLFPSRPEAEESLFASEEEEGVRFVAEFDQSVAGLKTGAPITYLGIRIGTVVDVYLDIAGGLAGDSRTYAVLQFQPRRLGLEGLGPDELRTRFDTFVEEGSRVQLTTGNLLTGALAVRLVSQPDAPTASIDYAASPYPSFPTVPSSTEAIAADVQSILQKVANLPLEDLVANAAAAFAEIDALLGSPAVAEVPADLSEALQAFAQAAEQLEAATGSVSPNSELQVELIDAVREFREAARRIGALAQTLEEQPNALIVGRD
ncbi:intermembrane transport protein PqiB [Parvularcula dongshanensis]|uniref:Paraquat-inducible protein B n=1 Tax=Parvularcula dongshanensis TaxID=1173995 RepID=A0A840I4R6_9PROT|nr:MlaD family protein [Parvularcula dongshanensis]MBB4659271.1 paraquat-inducible protein B [Parvularcula dongshanensis]